MRLVGWGCLFLLFLAGCASDSSMKKIDNYIFLHDNSSKMWLVDKLMLHDNDYTPLRFRNKQLVVFHKSRNAFFYRIHELGDKRGLKTYYWLDRQKNEFGFQFTKGEWIFEIKQLSRTRVVLKPKKGDYPYTIVLVPFPEY